MKRSENLEAYGLGVAGFAKGAFAEVVKRPISERIDSNDTSANLGWMALAGGVLAWDIFASETLSEGVDRALDKHKIATYAAVGATAAHLLNLIPEKVDPFHQFAKRTRAHRNN